MRNEAWHTILTIYSDLKSSKTRYSDLYLEYLYSYSEIQVTCTRKYKYLYLETSTYTQQAKYSDFHRTWQSKYLEEIGTWKKVLNYNTAEYSYNIFNRMHDEMTTAYTFFHRKKLVYIVNDICYSSLNIAIIHTSYEWNKHAEFSVIKSSIVEYIITNYNVIIHTPTYVW